MAREPYDPASGAHFQPAAPSTQEELGGVLERAFVREGGREPGEEETRRLHAWADEALAASEGKLALAREAEAAMEHAAERNGRSRDAADLAEVERWTEAAGHYRREAEELRLHCESLRQRIA